jgi:uncharacterized protein (TIGR02284 family)
MSADQKTTEDLTRIAEDGKDGYAKAADELADSDRPELAEVFRGYSQQRAGFSAELQELAHAYGDEVKDSGTVAAAIHRGWLALRDAVTGSGPDSVLKTALQGEDHAITAYEKALAEDISEGSRTVFSRQLAEVRSARDRVQELLGA